MATPAARPKKRARRNARLAIAYRALRAVPYKVNRFLHDNGRTEAERELLAAKLVGRWRSGAPLALASEADDPALGEDPRRINNFGYRDRF